MNPRDGPTSPPAHFSVHAEFTISHPGAANPRNRPRTSTERDEATGGVRMTYSWNSPGTAPEPWPTSASNSNKSIASDSASSAPTLTPPRLQPPSAMFDTDYTRGYQKGNMFFTSTPPPTGGEDAHEGDRVPKQGRNVAASMLGRGLIHDSSGYGSDLLSPNSLGGSLPRGAVPPLDRKCRSTCNIVLSPHLQGSAPCSRTQSLRCQSPSSLLHKHPQRFYGCGDPWCHHWRPSEDCCKISPVPEETTPLSTKTPSRSDTYTAPSQEKKDASVQTFEMVDKCTSPFLRMNSTESEESRNIKRYQRRGLTEPIRKNPSPLGGGGAFTPDSLDSIKSNKRLVRSPNLRRLAVAPKEPAKEQSPVDSKSGDSLKKPRTVHIDVYCTGTEMESNASSSESSDEGSKSASTPQTVFENEKMRVTHRKADERDLPFYLKNRPRERTPVKKTLEAHTSMEKEESDEENSSTAYPSKLSSYSNIGDLSASVSSVPRSWTSYSLSSCAIPEDYDSVANTSWKDTFSDIDSLLLSRSSIAPTESLDFVPRRRLEAAQSIDEAPEFERKNFLDTSSLASVQPSDSFEYADSEDRHRIRQMEEMWKNRGSSKSLKSPVSEQTLQIQQERMRDYIEKKMRNKSKWDSKDSDSNESDDSGKGWTFIKGSPTSQPDPTNASRQKSPVNALPNTVRDAFNRSVRSAEPVPETRSVTPQRPSPMGDLSPTSLRQRLSGDPTLRSPFMIVPGIYTEPRSIARKFGTVISVMKKPGHHVGPAKNPDCLCEHCQSYWVSVGGRNRTRSVGDPPSGRYIQNWKQFLEQRATDGGKPEPPPFSDI